MPDRCTQKMDTFQRALEALNDSLQDYQAFPEARAFRDSVMLNFMLTHEQATKQLARYIKTRTIEGQDPNKQSLKELIRIAWRYGLIKETDSWFEYGSARNNVVHVYDENQASTLSASVPQFYADALFLFQRLEERLRHEDQEIVEDEKG